MDVFDLLRRIDPQRAFADSFPESWAPPARIMSREEHVKRYTYEPENGKVTFDVRYIAPSMRILFRLLECNGRIIYSGDTSSVYETVYLSHPNVAIYAKGNGSAIITVGIPEKCAFTTFASGMKIREGRTVDVRFGLYGDAELHEFTATEPVKVDQSILKELLLLAKKDRKPVVVGGLLRESQNLRLDADLFNVDGRVFAYLEDAGQGLPRIQPRSDQNRRTFPAEV